MLGGGGGFAARGLGYGGGAAGGRARRGSGSVGSGRPNAPHLSREARESLSLIKVRLYKLRIQMT
jgi:hypothetical protein